MNAAPSRFVYLAGLSAILLFSFAIKTPAPIFPILIQNFSGTPITSLTFSNLSLGESYRLQHKTGWYWTDVSTSFTASDTFFSQMITGSVRSVDYRLAVDPVPDQAFAVAQISNGMLVTINITNSGSGYLSTPTVNLFHGGGTNANVVAVVSDNGNVTNLIIINSGSNYLRAPTIQIAPPPANAVYPEAQPLIRFKFAASAIGWSLMAATNLSGNWWSVTNLTSSQVDLPPPANSVFFRMTYP